MASWRDTLFIWKGLLKGAAWDGQWIGIDSADALGATPSAKDFSESLNNFSLTLEGGEEGKFSSSEIKPGVEVWATAGAGYLLDQNDGQGHKRYNDAQHRVRFCREQNSDWLVVASGKNEFAPFVSLGKYGKDGELILARRYLDEKDERVRWTLEDLAVEVGSAIDIAAPWRHEVLHSKVFRKRKSAAKARANKATQQKTSSISPSTSIDMSSADKRKSRARHIVLMKFKANCEAGVVERAKEQLLQLREKVPGWQYKSTNTVAAAGTKVQLLTLTRLPGIINITFGDTFTHDRAQVIRLIIFVACRVSLK